MDSRLSAQRDLRRHDRAHEQQRRRQPLYALPADDDGAGHPLLPPDRHREERALRAAGQRAHLQRVRRRRVPHPFRRRRGHRHRGHCGESRGRHRALRRGRNGAIQPRLAHLHILYPRQSVQGHVLQSDAVAGHRLGGGKHRSNVRLLLFFLRDGHSAHDLPCQRHVRVRLGVLRRRHAQTILRGRGRRL